MDHKMSRSPWVIHYDGSSCNGCDIEVLASLTPLFDAERFGVVNTGNPKHADIFLVTGSVNAQNLPVVRQIYNQMLEPKCVVACGICACSGGVFRDAYNVIGGVDRAIPVDVYAPGCAIRPETVIDAIVEACGILDQKEAVMRAGGDPLTVGGAATWDGGVELGGTLRPGAAQKRAVLVLLHRRAADRAAVRQMVGHRPLRALGKIDLQNFRNDLPCLADEIGRAHV